MTNLAIKRELMAFFRARNISTSNRYGAFQLFQTAIDIHDGYVYAYMIISQGVKEIHFTYMVEYFNPVQWYNKFVIMHNRTTVVSSL